MTNSTCRAIHLPTNHQPLLRLVQSCFAALEPPPEETVSECAEKHRYLQQENSAQGGKWHTANMPFTQGIMDAYNDPSVKVVAVMKSSQVGMTEVLLNIILYAMYRKPGPIMYVMPKIDAAEKFSRKRVDGMVRDCTVLRGLVAKKNAKGGENTLLYKKFKGGSLTLVGSNSATDVSSDPIRDGLIDELDRCSDAVGKDGDVIRLVETRQTTFRDGKLYLISTPLEKGASKIERAFLRGDQRRFFVACPHCGGMQYLKWGGRETPFGVKWSLATSDSSECDDAWYECEHCHEPINDGQRLRMVRAGHWRATAKSKQKGLISFHVWSAYNPFIRLSELVNLFLASKDNPEELRTFVNTRLGESWDEPGESVEEDVLMSRREHYAHEVPEGVLLLTMGVDIQKDRIEALVVGWGKGEESWRIDASVFHGDPSQPQVWDELAGYMDIAWSHPLYGKMSVEAVGVDTGYMAEMGYAYAQKHKGRAFAIKGIGGKGLPILGSPSRKRTGKTQRKVDLFPVGDFTAKDLIMKRLKAEKPGAGFYHFSDQLEDEYFAQLTSEKKVKRKARNGFFFKEEWVQTRPRNEALDMEKYNLAALYWKMGAKPNFEARAQRMASKIKKEGEVKIESTAETKVKRKRSGYVDRWRG